MSHTHTHTHTHCSVHARLSRSHQVREFDLIGEFIAASEAVSQRPCATLRGTAHSQARDFLKLFHDKQKEKLAHLLANERWTRANVPAECQQVVDWLALSVADARKDTVASTSSSDGVGGGSGAAAAVTGSSAPHRAVVGGAAAATPTASTVVAKVLRAGDVEFRAVGAALMYLRIIKDYVYCAEAIVPLAQDVMTKLLDNLRLFNQRTKKLVLQVRAHAPVRLPCWLRQRFRPSRLVWRNCVCVCVGGGEHLWRILQ
jgi:hypothetical protein